MFPKISVYDDRVQDPSNSHIFYWMSPDSVITKHCLDESRIELLTLILKDLGYLIETHQVQLLEEWDNDVQLIKSKYNMVPGKHYTEVCKNYTGGNDDYVYIGSEIKTLDIIPNHPVSFIIDTFIDKRTKTQFKLCPCHLPLINNDFDSNNTNGHIPYENIFKNLED